MASGLMPWSVPFSAGLRGALVWSGLVGAIEARLPVREWDGAELPIVLSGMSWWACIGSVVLLEEVFSVVEGLVVDGVIVEAVLVEGVMVEVVLADGVVPGAAKSVLVPVGTFAGRLFGGSSFMSSKP
jgi:hypothetical protein